jgi:hypothetical protein
MGNFVVEPEQGSGEGSGKSSGEGSRRVRFNGFGKDSGEDLGGFGADAGCVQ